MTQNCRKSGKKYKKIATTTYSSYVAFSADTSTVCNMTLNAVQKSKNTVKLNWTKVKGAEKYLVYRSSYASGDNSYSKKNGSNTNAKWKLIKTIKKSKTTSYTDKKLTAGETYNYLVVAVYQVKKVTKQIDATAGVVLDLQAPQNAVAYASGSQIRISWDTDKFAKQYEVRYTRYNAQGKAYTKRPATSYNKDLKCYDIPEDADVIVKETNTDESSTYSVARYHDYKNQKNTKDSFLWCYKECESCILRWNSYFQDHIQRRKNNCFDQGSNRSAEI